MMRMSEDIENANPWWSSITNNKLEGPAAEVSNQVQQEANPAVRASARKRNISADACLEQEERDGDSTELS